MQSLVNFHAREIKKDKNDWHLQEGPAALHEVVSWNLFSVVS